MTTDRYSVLRVFNGETRTTASTHRTLATAERAAAKLLRAMGEGWGVRIARNGVLV